jgi:acyl CoA:acetate/3-ketoacid CoA transferase alpha subunit
MPPVRTDLASAAALVKDGDLVALGGHPRNAPMALIRDIIRQGRHRLS